MQYYGIRTPDDYIWWLSNTSSGAWRSFFQYPNIDGNFNPHRAPLYEAIKAYKLLGYRCVELELKVKETVNEMDVV